MVELDDDLSQRACVDNPVGSIPINGRPTARLARNLDLFDYLCRFLGRGSVCPVTCIF
jgi:hypothetical protein